MNGIQKIKTPRHPAPTFWPVDRWRRRRCHSPNAFPVRGTTRQAARACRSQPRENDPGFVTEVTFWGAECPCARTFRSPNPMPL
jgi:hypothetical protein